MDKITLWYCTDNEDGIKVFGTLKYLGLNINLVSDPDFKNCNLNYDNINIFIIDLIKVEVEDILQNIRRNENIAYYLKFVILKKRQIRRAIKLSNDIINIEYISRPVNKREFALLIEKSVVVERYKQMLNKFSNTANDRIELYENIIDINRKDTFIDGDEKSIFKKIVEFEKNIINEQKKLNDAILYFAKLRKDELFDLKKRIDAEEMLAELRRKELLDANKIIEAQSAVIELSAKEIKQRENILEATEKVQELSRLEAMKLIEQLKSEKEKNKELQNKINELQNELKKLKKII